MGDHVRTSTIWSLVEVVLRQGVNFGIGIWLARLLTPDDFGTIASLFLFTTIASVLAGGGLTHALVQKDRLSSLDKSTAFWISTLLSLVFAALVCALGYPLAELLDKPVLTLIAMVMAVNTIVSMLGATHGAIMLRELRFKDIAISGIVSTLCSGILAIWLATTGAGIWALAWQVLAASVINTILVWIRLGWAPAPAFSLTAARQLFGFGGYILAAQLIDAVYTRVHSVSIGALQNVEQAGFYNRAESLSQLVSAIVLTVVNRVALPAFARQQNDVARLGDSLLQSIRVTTVIIAPMALGLAAVAGNLVAFLLGPQWQSAAAPLAVLGASMVLLPAHVLNQNVVMATGKGKAYFKQELLKRLIGICLVLGGSFFGITWVAWAFFLTGGFSFFLTAFYVQRDIGLPILQQVKQIIPPLLAAAVMAVCTVMLAAWLQAWSLPARLAVSTIAGAMIYCALLLCFKPALIREFLAIMRGRQSDFDPENLPS
jgi:teichuronic acid exporter